MRYNEFNAVCAQMGHCDVSCDTFRVVVEPLLGDWDAKLDAETVASLVHMPGFGKVLDALVALVKRKKALIRELRHANDALMREKLHVRRLARRNLRRGRRGRGRVGARGVVFPVACDPPYWHLDAEGRMVVPAGRKGLKG